MWWEKKTNRALIIHEANQTGGVGAEIASSISKDLFEFLDAPVEQLRRKAPICL